MEDQTRHNANCHQNTSEPPRLYIAHYQASRIDHTGVGEYHRSLCISGLRPSIRRRKWCMCNFLWTVLRKATRNSSVTMGNASRCLFQLALRST